MTHSASEERQCWFGRALLFALSAGVWLAAAALPTVAQVSAEEQASHHPKGEQTQQPSGSPGGMKPGTSGQSPGGMADMMGKMMGGMPAKKDFYPSLMNIPELTPEKRIEISTQSDELMKSGTTLLGSGLDRLNEAMARNDYGAIQKATEQMREGLTKFESGVAGHRLLAEGKAPRDVALHWFRTEMSLPQPGDGTSESGFSLFHITVMVILIIFAAVMIGMYFFKMRRASSLLRQLAGNGPNAAPIGVPTGHAQAKASFPAPTAVTVNSPLDEGVVSGVLSASRPGKWSGKLRLVHVFNETPDVKTFRLADPLGGEMPFVFQPGQYVTVTVSPEGKPIRRNYTIASSPTERTHIEITIKREEKGSVSRYLHDRIQPGDLLDFTGPSGSFVFTGRECRCLVFIAAGVGITPAMSVARYLTAKSWPGEIYIVYSCRRPQDFIFKDELEFLQRRHPNLHVTVTASKGGDADWKGATGRITKDLIVQVIPDIRVRRVHICGPNEMMSATAAFLEQIGVPKEQVKTESFGAEFRGATLGPESSTSTTSVSTPAAEVAKPSQDTIEAPAAGKPVASMQAVSVTFSRTAKTAPLPPGKSILEVSEEIGVNIPFECRTGTCGTCRVKLLAGTVTMDIEDGLEADDKKNNIILACQAKSAENVTVDA